ncbi:MAG: hypothetical protein LLG04_02215 [Parachlamydia sp.]|nr:hypothetical protein [Parachlamydia sp.]
MKNLLLALCGLAFVFVGCESQVREEKKTETRTIERPADQSGRPAERETIQKETTEDR